jgi:CRP/FNR family cyclic AMP-dependent transcriptional regulator
MAGRLKGNTSFKPDSFLRSSRVAKQRAYFAKGQTVFTQGELGTSVLYLTSGVTKLSAINEDGNEAVIAILEGGDFLGESCLSDACAERSAKAVALEPTSALVIQKQEMMRILCEELEFRNFFISYLLMRNTRTEADLVDQLSNSSEKRLARVLLQLAGHDRARTTETFVLNLPQETLAELVGTTRSRVNVFMNKFRRQGLIDYSRGKLRVHNSLLGSILHE